MIELEKKELEQRKLKKIRKKIRYLYKKYKNCFVKLLTITFKDNEQFLDFKQKDWDKMRMNLRNGYGVMGGFWVLEEQERGVLHYHILLFTKKKIPYLDKQGLYNVGMTQVKNVRGIKHVLNYVMKYLLKLEGLRTKRIYKKQRLYGFWTKKIEDLEYLKITNFRKYFFVKDGIKYKEEKEYYKEYVLSYEDRKIKYRLISEYDKIMDKLKIWGVKIMVGGLSFVYEIFNWDEYFWILEMMKLYLKEGILVFEK